MALTLIPADAHCLASSRVSPIRPVLEATYPAWWLPPEATIPSIEATLTMLPPRPWLIISRAAAADSTNAEVRLTSSTRRNWAGSCSWARTTASVVPALLTTMSGPPCSAATSTTRWSCESSVTSQPTGTTPATSPARASSRSSLRAAATTVAPLDASSRQYRWPRVPLAPVTTATLPCTEKRSSLMDPSPMRPRRYRQSPALRRGRAGRHSGLVSGSTPRAVATRFV